MNPKPLISVIIPAFNAQAYIVQAIESVLIQTSPQYSLEILCVDDASSDATRTLLENFGDAITVVHNLYNRGIGAARNEGVARAHGDFIAFLDADDMWHPDKLSKQLHCFTANPGLDMVFCLVESFISPELPDNVRQTRYCPPIAKGYLPSAMLVRRASFARVGPFITNVHMGEFIDWYARAQEMGLQADVVPEALLLRRIHTTNTGIKKRDSRKEYAQVLGEMLRRRRP